MTKERMKPAVCYAEFQRREALRRRCLKWLSVIVFACLLFIGSMYLTRSARGEKAPKPKQVIITAIPKQSHEISSMTAAKRSAWKATRAEKAAKIHGAKTIGKRDKVKR